MTFLVEPRGGMRNATISEATGRRTHNAEHRIINTHHERLTYDEYFQVSPRRVVSQHKGTDLICVPATFGISAMLDPQCRERRLVTMNTTSGCSMHKCLKASTSTRHTTQHKPQFGRARGGLPAPRIRQCEVGSQSEKAKSKDKKGVVRGKAILTNATSRPY